MVMCIKPQVQVATTQPALTNKHCLLVCSYIVVVVMGDKSQIERSCASTNSQTFSGCYSKCLAFSVETS